jgi:hypothetical protein
MRTLIYDLLVTEAWKEKVFPLIRNQIATVSSIRAYMAVSYLSLILARSTTSLPSQTFSKFSSIIGLLPSHAKKL